MQEGHINISEIQIIKTEVSKGGYRKHTLLYSRAFLFHALSLLPSSWGNQCAGNGVISIEHQNPFFHEM